MSTPLHFQLPDGSGVEVDVALLLNAGYAGRDQAGVRAHIDELAALGVPAPSVTPSLYPVSAYLAQQTESVQVQHERTSGEAEWALVVAGEGDDDVLLTVASDHTDRALEVHGVAWSKNASPDVLGTRAWRLPDVVDHLDRLRLTARAGGRVVQDGTLAELLAPAYWLDVLEQRGLRTSGTVLLSGTIPMAEGVDQFTGRWEVTLSDPVTGAVLDCGYDVLPLPAPIG